MLTNKHLNYLVYIKTVSLINFFDFDPILFEDLLKSSNDYYLECSCKIENNKVYPTRFNIFYDYKNHVKNINLIFSFFKKISKYPAITINYNLIKKIFDKKFDLNKTERVITGLDLRDNLDDSRIKMSP